MNKKTFFIPITMDLSIIQNKIFLGLSFRQIVCFGIGLGFGFISYYFAKDVNTDLATLLLMVTSAPFVVFGFYNRDGLYLEDLLNNYIQTYFLGTAIRERKKNKQKKGGKP